MQGHKEMRAYRIIIFSGLKASGSRGIKRGNETLGNMFRRT